MKMADYFPELSTYKLSDKMIKQFLLLNSVIAKYCDLLATDISQYFAQPHPIIILLIIAKKNMLLVFASPV